MQPNDWQAFFTVSVCKSCYKTAKRPRPDQALTD